MTLNVTRAIYWNALILRLKGCPFYAHPKKSDPSTPNRMKANCFCEPIPPPSLHQRRARFFGRILINQLNKIEHGWLELHFDGSVHSFGRAILPHLPGSR